MKPELRVALLGQGFMGKAHSNAYAQAGHFYDLPYRVRRTLLCGRDAASLARDGGSLGLGEHLNRLARRHRSSRHRHRRHRPAESSARTGGDRRRRSRQDRLLREATGAVGRGRSRDGRGGTGPSHARVVQLPARAGHCLRASADRRRPARADLTTTTRPTGSSGARTRRGTATWQMDPAQAGSGVADDLLTHLLDTACI